MQGPELNIAKNIKAIEWLKTELTSSLASLFKALFKGNTEGAMEALAVIVINSFLLAKRLGVSYGRLELAIHNRMKELLKEKHPLEEWYGDLSSLKEYTEIKRGD